MDARDFAELVSAVMSCLRCVEQENGSGVAVRYRLVGLELGSAVVAIRLESEDDQHSTAREVATGFEQGFRALKESKMAETACGGRTQQSFVALHKALRRGNQAIELTGRAQHRLDLEMLPRTPRTRKREVDPLGSFSGRVKETASRGLSFP